MSAGSWNAAAVAHAPDERLRTLVELAEQMAAGRPAGDLLPLVTDGARRLLGATGATLTLIGDGDLVVAARSGVGVAPGAGAGAAISLERRVATAARPLRVADLGQSDESPSVRPNGVRSYVGVPVLVRGRVCGVLAAYANEPNRFTDEDVTLLSGLAAHAAAALEHGRLLEELGHHERLSTVGRMVAGVAHDLNNPLAVVIGTAKLLRQEPIDGRLAQRLARVEGQAERAMKVVQSLLTLARKKPPKRTRVDVNELVGATLRLDDFHLEHRRIAVVRRFQADLPPVEGNPNELQQVFTNLFLNAFQALREAPGQRTLTVTTALDPEQERVRVAVSDDGPGIPTEYLERIFEPFFTTKSEGTGLGLAICRRIVEGHGGRIAIASRPGDTRVTVDLPVARTRETPRVTPLSRAATPSGIRVLVVEDENLVADLVSEILSLDGHQVDRAANGREALVRVGSRRYGLVVSDVNMPDLNGPAFYGALLSVDPALARRVIFITGDVLSTDTRRFLQQTGLPYLEKPFGITTLQAAVRDVLRATA